MPGVQVAGNQVNVRGSSGFSYNTGSRVLFLLDGVPLLSPDADGVPLDLIPSAAIERIEVTRGPGSALYGGSALGGVIQVITRDAPSELFAEASVQAGLTFRPGTRSGARRGAAAISRDPTVRRRFRWADQASASAGGCRWPLWPTRATSSADVPSACAGSAALTYALTPRTRVGLTALARRSRSDAFLYWNSLADPLSVGRLEFGSVRASGASRNVSDAVTFIPQIVHSSARVTLTMDARVTTLGLRPLDANDTPRTLADGTTGIRYGASAQALWQAGGVLWTTGVSGDANSVRASVFSSSTFLAQPEVGAFVQAERRVGQAHVTTGLRGDAYFIDSGDVERQLSPSLAIRYPVAGGLIVRTSIGTGFRVPSIAERFVDDTSFLPLASNVELRPETSLGLDAGLRFARGAWEAEATFFAARYRRLTEAVFVPDLGAFQFRNVASARTIGTENRIGYRNRKWDAWIAYQLIRTRDDATGDPLPFRPAHLAQAHAGWKSSRWALGTFGRYQSAPSNTQTDFARFVPDANRLGDARVIDLYVQAYAGPFSVQLNVRNALNYAYAERPASLAPARSIDVTLTARL